ncbi:MAG: CPBP family intramembrane metalloprotease [Anaerolineae bacterium]|jgi:membrane protease YdiL (CAAX protease family)|nr:CPBP family intramembrane metalloprotease [Anaerolineae bacterium]
MRPSVSETSGDEARDDLVGTSTKTRLLVLLEVCLVFAAVMIFLVAFTPTRIYQWEKQHLGWSYAAMAFYVGIPIVAVVLTRQKWSEYGVSSADWRTNLDTGIKATIVRTIPTLLGWWGVGFLGLSQSSLGAGVIEACLWIVALALIIGILRRQTPKSSARGNLTMIGLFLLLPIGVGLAMSKLNLVVVSTIVWQFVLSGFGEEFVYRGYYQSRLNQAFGRPIRLFGVQFGAGLIGASLLFGLNHALNTYDAAVGLSSLAWGPALATFAAGVFFGVLREKTGTLVAPGLAHGFLDAVGEPLMKVYGIG